MRILFCPLADSLYDIGSLFFCHCTERKSANALGDKHNLGVLRSANPTTLLSAIGTNTALTSVCDSLKYVNYTSSGSETVVPAASQHGTDKYAKIHQAGA